MDRSLFTLLRRGTCEILQIETRIDDFTADRRNGSSSRRRLRQDSSCRAASFQRPSGVSQPTCRSLCIENRSTPAMEVNSNTATNPTTITPSATRSSTLLRRRRRSSVVRVIYLACRSGLSLCRMIVLMIDMNPPRSVLRNHVSIMIVFVVHEQCSPHSLAFRNENRQCDNLQSFNLPFSFLPLS
jgi:hypothetical protein